MVRDHSAFLPGAAPARRAPTALERLGWGPAFASQIDADTSTETPPVRVVAAHRSGLKVMGDGVDKTIPPVPEATVGDWLLYDRARPRSSRVLDRKSRIKRHAPGTGREAQLTDAATGIADVFEDIGALTARCRLTNGQYEAEPGCANLTAEVSLQNT